MNERDFTRLDQDLDRAIDDLNDERAPVSSEDDGHELEEFVDTVRILRRLREPAWPDDAFVDSLAETLEKRLVASHPPTDRIHQNGYGTVLTASTLLKLRRLATLRLVAAAMVRSMGVCMLAGAFAGILSGGIGGRIAMRISAWMYLRDNPDSSAAITESSGRQVGTFSLGGTADLVIQAAFMGFIGGMAYLVVKHWLPGSTRRRGLTYGLILLILFGSIIIEASNRDFQRFGPVALNVAMFASIFIVFGAIIAPAADRIQRWLPPSGSRKGFTGRGTTRRLSQRLVELAIYGLGALGLLAIGMVLVSATVEFVTVLAELTGILHAREDIATVGDVLFLMGIMTLAVLAVISSAAHSTTGQQLASLGTSRLSRPLIMVRRRDVTIVLRVLFGGVLLICLGITLRAIFLTLTATP